MRGHRTTIHHCERCDASWRGSKLRSEKCPKCGVAPGAVVATREAAIFQTNHPRAPHRAILTRLGDDRLEAEILPRTASRPYRVTATYWAEDLISLNAAHGPWYFVISSVDFAALFAPSTAEAA